MKSKKLFYGILAIAIVAIAGVSLFYYLNNPESTIAWKLPFIHEREDRQPTVDKTNDKIIVGVEAGPIARECFNKSYLIETADYIIEGTIEKVEEKKDMETGIYSYVYLTVEKYLKGESLSANKLQINVTVRTPLTFHEGEKVRIYLKNYKERLLIFCGHYGVEEIKPEVAETKEDFCGWSTDGKCSSDSDCIMGGCSAQVCQSKYEESITTTCEWRDCFDAIKYGLKCRCIDGRCQWSEIEPTKEVPTMMDIPHLTPQLGEYFTYRGNKSKILLNDSRLKYCFLNRGFRAALKV